MKPSFILEQFRGIIEYTHAGLFAVEESNLIVLTTRNPKELEQAPPLNIQLDVPETLTSLFTKQRPIRIANVRGDDPAAKFLRSFLGNEVAAMFKEARSWMWVPLAVKGRIIAVIGLAHSDQDYFTARHADMAMNNFASLINLCSGPWVENFFWISSDLATIFSTSLSVIFSAPFLTNSSSTFVGFMVSSFRWIAESSTAKWICLYCTRGDINTAIEIPPHGPA